MTRFDRTCPDCSSLLAADDPTCGTCFADRPRFGWAPLGSARRPVGELLDGRYLVLGRVGSLVFRAIDLQTGKEVITKIRAGGVGATSEREFAALRKAARTSVPTPLTLLADGRRSIIVMERVCGMSLREWIAQDGLPEMGRAVRLVQRLASSVADLHGCGVAHGNLSSDHILVDGPPRQERPRLVGFSRAKVLAGNAPLGAADETPLHHDQPARASTPEGDVHAVGEVLRLLTYPEAAWSCGRAAALELRDVIASATDADPAARPTASALAARLSALDVRLTGLADADARHGERSLPTVAATVVRWTDPLGPGEQVYSLQSDPASSAKLVVSAKVAYGDLCVVGTASGQIGRCRRRDLSVRVLFANVSGSRVTALAIGSERQIIAATEQGRIYVSDAEHKVWTPSKVPSVVRLLAAHPRSPLAVCVDGEGNAWFFEVKRPGTPLGTLHVPMAVGARMIPELACVEFELKGGDCVRWSLESGDVVPITRSTPTAAPGPMWEASSGGLEVGIG